MYTRSLSDFDRLIADTEPVGCVVLTTISTHFDVNSGRTVARDINTRIWALHRQNPRKYQVVDWNALIHTPLGLLHWSGLPPHENVAGEQWFADQYAQALLRCGVSPLASRSLGRLVKLTHYQGANALAEVAWFDPGTKLMRFQMWIRVQV